MPDLALCPKTGDQPVCGLWVDELAEVRLWQKLNARSVHYAHLQVAKGAGWTFIFGEGDKVGLPWLPDSPVFFYRLGQGLYCQTGFGLNCPEVLLPRLLPRLQTDFGLSGAIAMRQSADGPIVHDLSLARPLAQIALAQVS